VYSCSPFHVRFGKLQVLRAGEKRVRHSCLPRRPLRQHADNLPSENGHRAPVWMKVGEAGEAFFVVETDAEVPEELQTSPVMSATQVSLGISDCADADFDIRLNVVRVVVGIAAYITNHRNRRFKGRSWGQCYATAFRTGRTGQYAWRT
jgi:hypothetical protein